MATSGLNELQIAFVCRETLKVCYETLALTFVSERNVRTLLSDFQIFPFLVVFLQYNYVYMYTIGTAVPSREKQDAQRHKGTELMCVYSMYRYILL